MVLARRAHSLMGSRGSRSKSPQEVARGADSWQVLSDVSLEKWVRCHAARWGFDTTKDYRLKKDDPSQTPCISGRHLRVLRGKEDLLEEDIFEWFTKSWGEAARAVVILERRLRGKVYYPVVGHCMTSHDYGSYYEDAYVIGSSEGLTVIQLTVKGRSDIEIWMINSRSQPYHLKRTIRVYLPSPALFEAYISPDETRFILKPNYYFLQKIQMASVAEDVARLIKVNQRRRDLPRFLFPGEALRRVFAYDPRHPHRVVAMGNCSDGDECDHVVLFDLSREQVLLRSDTGLVQTCGQLTFTPDGSCLVSSLVLDLDERGGDRISTGMYMYLTEDLTITRHVTYSPMDLLLLGYGMFPQFSNNGLYMAHLTQVADPGARLRARLPQALRHVARQHEPVFRVKVSAVPVEIRLQNICRTVICTYLCNYEIYDLPLPTALKEYLLYRS